MTAVTEEVGNRPLTYSWRVMVCMVPPVTNSETTSFAQFELDPRLLAAIESLGFEHPTPIQRDAIPLLCTGADVIGRARTGSGKTAAFGLPMLQRVREGGVVRGLVLAPTRELAIQVSDALSALAVGLPIEVLTIYGGASYRTQLRGLKRGATVVVGTPGRVIDLLNRGALPLDAVEYFVLDEADEMLRMGFVEDVEHVVAALPDDRQVALFSATMPDEIQRVVRKYVPNAIELQVEDEALSVGHIDQRFVRAKFREKERALLRLLAGLRTEGVLVFARTRKRCGEVAQMLIENGINADALHGDLNQGARERVLGRLRSRALEVVVATDVAARGLDVDHLSHVINFDMPEDAEVYTHRIGRTARAGRSGMAITLIEPRDHRKRLHFERELGIQIQQMELPTAHDIRTARRDELVDLIGHELANPQTVDTRTWVRSILTDKGWSAEDVASAAIQLLGRELNFELEESSDEPVRYDSINEVEVIVSLGRRDGIRPADIVGTFTNDLDIPANHIGRISLGSRRAYVGLPSKVATALIEAHASIELRGKPTTITLNPSTPQPDTGSKKPRRHSSPTQAKSEKKPRGKRKNKSRKKTRAKRNKKK